MDKCPAEFVDLSGRLADAAGGVIAKYFRQPFDVITKDDDSPVTIADRESEQVMRDLIEAAFPEHGIVGEEHGTVRPDAEYVWYLDPIDGTKSFICGVPLFGTLIGLVHNVDGGPSPILGIIDQPIAKERWTGAVGHGADLNGQAITTRACAGVDQATLFSTGPEYFDDKSFEAFQRVRAQSNIARFGGDCYAYGLLASGWIDLVVEWGLAVYDYCALIPVVEAAGGIVTTWAGKAHAFDGRESIVASGDRSLHEEVIAILNN